jgi:hypothetical protein
MNGETTQESEILTIKKQSSTLSGKSTDTID